MKAIRGIFNFSITSSRLTLNRSPKPNLLPSPSTCAFLGGCGCLTSCAHYPFPASPFFSPDITLLSFFDMPREDIPISETHVGELWRYAAHQPVAPDFHRHDALEVNLVTSGTGRYLVDQACFNLRRGTQIWLFPEQEHLLVDRSPDFQMYIAVFRPEMVEQVCTTATKGTRIRGRLSGTGFCF